MIESLPQDTPHIFSFQNQGDISSVTYKLFSGNFTFLDNIRGINRSIFPSLGPKQFQGNFQRGIDLIYFINCDKPSPFLHPPKQLSDKCPIPIPCASY